MGRWVGQIKISNAPGGAPDGWVVASPLTYISDAGWRLTVKPGAITDGASIPRIAWRLFGPPLGDTYTGAAVLHDTLYRTQGANGMLSRAQCDEVFFQAMLDSGVSWWRAYAMWAAVRAGGWAAWDEANAVLCWRDRLEVGRV